jgi:hypothetical protein
MTRHVLLVTVLLAVGGRAGAGEDPCSFSQWGQSAAHDGEICSFGQPAKRKLATLAYDPFVEQEKAETFGALFVHYQVPLTDGPDDVYIMSKTGSYVSCDPPGSGEPAPCGPDAFDTQVWMEKRLRWQGPKLVEKWTFTSDWKPFATSPWEPMFQPAISGPFIYVPGAGGSVWQVLKVLGVPIQRIKPFAGVDAGTYTAGGITADRFGFIYWNVIRVDPTTGVEKDYLVAAAPWAT